METPVVTKVAYGRRYLAAQSANLRDWVPQISFRTFQKHLLPGDITEEQVAAIKLKLKLGAKLDDGGRWTAFPKPPSKAGGGETQIFKGLGTVFKDIVDVVQTPSDTTRLKYFSNPNRAPLSQRLKSSSRPDGYALLADADPSDNSNAPATQHYWHDIAWADEYKKGKSTDDRDDNIRKVLWSMQQIMRSDVRRRFTFGLTIEDTETRLWFCNRAVVLVSETFDFLEDSDKLIYFISSMFFASATHLGWDPTIKRVVLSDEVFYDTTVHFKTDNGVEEQIYRLNKEIFEGSVDALRGPGTRVFEAHRLNAKGEPVGDLVALKDVWVCEGQPREGVILEMIAQSAELDDKTLIKDHFLEVLAHGDVIIENQPDLTRIPLPRYGAGEENEKEQGYPTHFFLESVSNVVRGWPARADSPGFSHKVHYRIVFKQLGKSLYDVTSMSDIFTALSHVIKALGIMHRAGWVHRDVSPGNIILYHGRGLLSDLEYAKRIDVDGKHELRVGTEDYMAVETEIGGYIFYGIEATTPPFFFNPLHDMESVWWIGIWFTLNFGHHDTPPHEAYLQATHSRDLFSKETRSLYRHHVLLAYRYGIIQPDIISSFQPVAAILKNALIALVAHYRIAEQGPTIDEAAYTHVIHDTLEELFFEAAQVSQNYPQLQPYIR